MVVVGTCAIGDRRGGINGRAARGRRARERKKKKRMEKQNQSLPPPWSSPYTADSTPYRNRARDSLTQIARVPCTTVHNHIGRRRHWGGFSLFLVRILSRSPHSDSRTYPLALRVLAGRPDNAARYASLRIRFFCILLFIFVCFPRRFSTMGLSAFFPARSHV